MLFDALPTDAKSVIWKLLREIGELRPLTRGEIRLRCMCAPQPWRDEGISYSTWCRRRRKQRLLVERQADPRRVAA